MPIKLNINGESEPVWGSVRVRTFERLEPLVRCVGSCRSKSVQKGRLLARSEYVGCGVIVFGPGCSAGEAIGRREDGWWW